MSLKLVLLVAGAIGLLFGILLLSGVNPGEAAQVLAKGSMGSPQAISGTLRETTPLLIAGLAVFVALRAGLFNIGVEGQLVIGAISATAVALQLPGPLGVIAGILTGMAAGALWALPAGWIKAYRNGHEVITTIMLNNIAGYLTAYLVGGVLMAPGAGTPTTKILPESTRIGALLSDPVRMSWGLLLGVSLACALAWMLGRTIFGYELRAVGANSIAARFAGVNDRKMVMLAMLGSGAIAGLAGAVQVLAYEFRFYPDLSPGYGFDALGVALLSGGSALGVIPASLVFGALTKGGVSLAIFQVPKGLVGVILGMMILIAAAIRYRGVKTVA